MTRPTEREPIVFARMLSVATLMDIIERHAAGTAEDGLPSERECSNELAKRGIRYTPQFPG